MQGVGQVGLKSESSLPAHDHSSSAQGGPLNPATAFSPDLAAYLGTLTGATLTLNSTATLTHNNSAEVVKSSAIYVVDKTITFNAVYAGAVQIVFDLKTGTAGRQVDAEIVYTSFGGSPTVLQAGFTEATGSYVTQTAYLWTLPAGLAIGDIIEIWVKYDSSVAGAYVRNFKIQYTWQITAINGHTVATPIPVTDTTALNLTDTL
jgi:hypothetical protein